MVVVVDEPEVDEPEVLEVVVDVDPVVVPVEDDAAVVVVVVDVELFFALP